MNADRKTTMLPERSCFMPYSINPGWCRARSRCGG
jgi:hypothetical protein